MKQTSASGLLCQNLSMENPYTHAINLYEWNKLSYIRKLQIVWYRTLLDHQLWTRNPRKACNSHKLVYFFVSCKLHRWLHKKSDLCFIVFVFSVQFFPSFWLIWLCLQALGDVVLNHRCAHKQVYSCLTASYFYYLLLSPFMLIRWHLSI